MTTLNSLKNRFPALEAKAEIFFSPNILNKTAAELTANFEMTASPCFNV